MEASSSSEALAPSGLPRDWTVPVTLHEDDDWDKTRQAVLRRCMNEQSSVCFSVAFVEVKARDGELRHVGFDCEAECVHRSESDWCKLADLGKAHAYWHLSMIIPSRTQVYASKVHEGECCYLAGVNVLNLGTNEARARYYFEQGAATGSAEALLALRAFAVNDGDIDLVGPLLKQAADTGHPIAMRVLSQSYRVGHKAGVELNVKRADELLLELASEPYAWPDAQIEISSFAKKQVEALDWVAKAKDAGNEHAAVLEACYLKDFARGKAQVAYCMRKIAEALGTMPPHKELIKQVREGMPRHLKLRNEEVDNFRAVSGRQPPDREHDVDEDGDKKPPRIPDVCESCGTAEPASMCARCNGAWYCDRTCQRKNWSKHKLHCQRVPVGSDPEGD